MAFERTVNTPPRDWAEDDRAITEHAYRYGTPLLERGSAGV
jgi:hypothetical protein